MTIVNSFWRSFKTNIFVSVSILTLVSPLFVTGPALAQTQVDSARRASWITLAARNNPQFKHFWKRAEEGDTQARNEVFNIIKKEMGPFINEPRRLATQFRAMILLFDDMTLEQSIALVKARLSRGNALDFIKDSEFLSLFKTYLESEDFRFQFASESACPDFQLDKDDQSFSKIPVRNQGLYGNCYAHAAINALDAYRFKFARKEFDEEGLSSVHFANYLYEVISDKQENKEILDLDAGIPEKLLELLNTRKICPSFLDQIALQHLEKMNGQFREQYALLDIFLTGMNISRLYFFFSEEEVSQSLTKGKRDFERLLATKPFNVDNQKMRRFEMNMIAHIMQDLTDAQKEWLRHFFMGHAPKLFEGKTGNQALATPLTAELFYQGLREVSELKNNVRISMISKSRLGFIKGLEHLCGEEKIKIPMPGSSSYIGRITAPNFKTVVDHEYAQWLEGKSLTNRVIDKSVRTEQTPLILSLCAREAFPSFAQYSEILTTSHDRNVMMQSRSCDAHAVVLIGQKYNKVTKSCQYLIRNSWGKDHDYTYPKTERGDVWIPQQNVFNNVFKASHLTNTMW